MTGVRRKKWPRGFIRIAFKLSQHALVGTQSVRVSSQRDFMSYSQEGAEATALHCVFELRLAIAPLQPFLLTVVGRTTGEDSINAGEDSDKTGEDYQRAARHGRQPAKNVSEDDEGS